MLVERDAKPGFAWLQLHNCLARTSSTSWAFCSCKDDGRHMCTCARSLTRCGSRRMGMLLQSSDASACILLRSTSRAVSFSNSTDPTAICSCGWSWWCFHPVPWKAHASVAPHHGMRSTAVFRGGGSFLRWHASTRSDGGARAAVRMERARQLPPCQLRRVGLSHRRFDLRSRSIRFFSIPFVKISMVASHRLDPLLSPHRSNSNRCPGASSSTHGLPPPFSRFLSPPLPPPNPHTAEAPAPPPAFRLRPSLNSPLDSPTSLGFTSS